MKASKSFKLRRSKMKTFSQANRLVEWKLPKFLDFGPLCHFSVNFWARSSLFFPKAL